MLHKSSLGCENSTHFSFQNSLKISLVTSSKFGELLIRSSRKIIFKNFSNGDSILLMTLKRPTCLIVFC